MTEPTRTPDAASRFDHEGDWTSGGHEQFATPIRSAAAAHPRLAMLFADMLLEFQDRGLLTLDERRHWLGKWNEALDAS